MTQELRRLLGLCIGLVSVALFPLSAFAENYYWTAYLNADRGHYSSPEAACQRLESAVAPMAGSSQTAVYSHKVKIDEERYQCFYQVRRYSLGQWSDVGEPTNNVGNGGSALALRFGDRCPETKVYDTQTGECLEAPEPEPNQCETTNGQTVSHEHLMKSAVGQPTIDPPGSVCGNGCQYAFTYTPASNVYVYSSGNPPGVFGIYSYTGNGIECTENTLQTPGNPSEGETQDPDDTPPPEDGDKCPAGYIYNGTFCSPENPPEEPDPTDPTDPTDPENPTDPDDGSGGGGGGGGDDSGGGDGGDDGSDDGTGGGEGDGSGGGTGGSGDGSGEGDGEEGEEDSGSGPGFCDGDDCSFVAPTYFDGAETVPGFEESLAHVFDGIRSSPLGSAVGAISFPSGSGVCPSGTVMLFGRPITFDGHCTLWGEISGIFSALMLAVWCLLGVRIVLSS
ncbi:hypothetical protein [Stutzerimonas balearica]|uniref:hypothetical protein n=1 Tax=Stutzerimonas balearica TaxID=74829 RepID=UPI001BC8CACA|nr:hypothetical protein [Stutzerimonas balearica]